MAFLGDLPNSLNVNRLRHNQLISLKKRTLKLSEVRNTGTRFDDSTDAFVTADRVNGRYGGLPIIFLRWRSI